MAIFEQENFENFFIRTFNEDVHSEDLHWHKDKNDREVEVISCGDDWFFQEDNKLPFLLFQGNKFLIKKNIWHRIIKGKGYLKLKIQEIIS